MKYMVISDIHGGIDNLDIVLNFYKNFNCSKLLILGDLFNYKIDYNNDYIIDKLNLFKDSIVAVSGNCYNYVPNILFDMPDINKININNKNIIITHGHMYSKNYLSHSDCDIAFIGHSHIPNIEVINNKIIANPGSISKSRVGENSFIIVDNEYITIRNLNNEILKKYKI